MLYEQYLKRSLEIYTNIYEFLVPFSSSEPDTDINDVNNLMNNFISDFMFTRDEYVDLIDNNTSVGSRFPRKWDEYISIKNTEDKYVNLNVEFYIDHPKLNMYGIIISDQGFERHFTFGLTSDEDLKHTIKIGEGINLTLSDKIIDFMRTGDIIRKGKIICDVNDPRLLKLPFLYSYKKICEHEWVFNILHAMENEILRMSSIVKDSKDRCSKNIQSLSNSTFLLYN